MSNIKHQICPECKQLIVIIQPIIEIDLGIQCKQIEGCKDHE